jgi:hypothetical protein
MIAGAAIMTSKVRAAGLRPALVQAATRGTTRAAAASNGIGSEDGAGQPAGPGIDD